MNNEKFHDQKLKLKYAISLLTEEERDCGVLPPGYLYCMKCSRSEPYESIVCFNGFCPNQVFGFCLFCETRHLLIPDGTLIINYGTSEQLVSRGSGDKETWNHVMGKLKQKNIF